MKSKIALAAVLISLAVSASPVYANLAGASAGAPGGSSSTNTSFFGVGNDRLRVPIADLATPGGPGMLAIFDGGGDSLITFGVSFDPAEHGGNSDFILWTGEQTDPGADIVATLTSIRVQSSSGNHQDYTFNNVLTSSAPGSGQNVPNRVFLRDALAVASTGTLDMPNFNAVFFTISVTGGVDNLDTLSVDYVSNPEPGTLALFGLGLVGLGGVVVRRRRKLAAAQESAESDA